MSHERGRRSWRGGLAILVICLALVAIGVLNIGLLARDMLRLERLRNHGVVVHGWIDGKRIRHVRRGVHLHVVEYRYWPWHEFDKRYNRHDNPDYLCHPEVLKDLPAGEREGLLDLLRKAEEDAERRETMRPAADRDPPTCPERDPHNLSGCCGGRADVSPRLYDSLPAGQPVPVTMIPGEGGDHTIGRVDADRVWRVPLWRWDRVAYGAVFLIVGGGGLLCLMLGLWSRRRSPDGTVS